MKEQEGALWIDYDITREEIQNLRKICADLEAYRQDLLRTVSAIGECWHSSNAERFLEIANTKAENLDIERNNLLEIANWFDEYADKVKDEIDAAKRRHQDRSYADHSYR